MFENYKNLDPEYVAENTQYNNIPKKEYRDGDVVYVYNLKNKFSGYKWASRQCPTFEFDIGEKAYVELNAIVSYIPGEAPTEETVGKINQKFYNIKDKNVWTCTNRGQTFYRWVPEKKFELPINGEQEVILFENEEPILLKVFDIYGNLIDNFTLDFDQRTFTVEEELAKKLLPKTYHFCFYINNKKVKTIPVVVTDERDAFNKDIRKNFEDDDIGAIGCINPMA